MDRRKLEVKQSREAAEELPREYGVQDQLIIPHSLARRP